MTAEEFKHKFAAMAGFTGEIEADISFLMDALLAKDTYRASAARDILAKDFQLLDEKINDFQKFLDDCDKDGDGNE